MTKGKKVTIGIILFILIILVLLALTQNGFKHGIQSIKTLVSKDYESSTKGPPQLGVSITSDIPKGSKIREGQVVTFTVSVWNYGETNAENVNIRIDPVGIGANIGTVRVGNNVRNTYQVTMNRTGEIKATAWGSNADSITSSSYNLIIEETPIILYNTSKNLKENPSDVAYEGDTLTRKNYNQ